MALLTKTRTDGAAPATQEDRAVGMSVRDPNDTGEKQVWVEWKVQLPNGRYDYRSARCDPAVEAEILALPNFGLGMLKAADNTHPKVIV